MFRRLKKSIFKFQITLSPWWAFSPRTRSFICPLQILGTARTVQLSPSHWCVLNFTLEGLLWDRRLSRCSCSVIKAKISTRMPHADYTLWNPLHLEQNWDQPISHSLRYSSHTLVTSKRTQLN